MVAPWIIATIVTVVLNVAAYIITPKPKQPKPAAVEDAQYPTAEAGRPITKFWGTMTIKSPNVLWYGEKNARTYKIKV
jgi:hypothetical protein